MYISYTQSIMQSTQGNQMNQVLSSSPKKRETYVNQAQSFMQSPRKRETFVVQLSAQVNQIKVLSLSPTKGRRIYTKSN